MKSWPARIAVALAATVLLGVITLFTLSAMGAGVWLWLGTEHDLTSEPIAATQDLFTDYRARRKSERMSDAFRSGLDEGEDAEGSASEAGEDAVADGSMGDRGGRVGGGGGPEGSGAAGVVRDGRSKRKAGGSRGSGNKGDDDDDDGRNEGGKGDDGKGDDGKGDDGKGDDGKKGDDKKGDDKKGDDSSGCNVSGVTQKSGTSYEITEGFRKKYIKDSSKAQKQGKGAWYDNSKGKTVGIEVWKLKCAPTQAGLRNDDIILEVAGKDMTGTYNAWRAYERVKKDDNFTIKLKRDGEKMTLKYTVE